MSKAKYIYDNNRLRCKLKRTGYRNEIELQLQKKWFIFWIDCYRWMTVSEGFWGEEGYIGNPMKHSCQYGNISEVWKTGTLNIKTRVLNLFKEYYQCLLEERKRKEQFESI